VADYVEERLSNPSRETALEGNKGLMNIAGIPVGNPVLSVPEAPARTNLGKKLGKSWGLTRCDQTERVYLRLCLPIEGDSSAWSDCWVFASGGRSNVHNQLTCRFFTSKAASDLWVIGQTQRGRGAAPTPPLNWCFSRCAGWI
jgi:hypothetical protein